MAGLLKHTRVTFENNNSELQRATFPRRPIIGGISLGQKLPAFVEVGSCTFPVLTLTSALRKPDDLNSLFPTWTTTLIGMCINRMDFPSVVTGRNFFFLPKRNDWFLFFHLLVIVVYLWCEVVPLEQMKEKSPLRGLRACCVTHRDCFSTNIYLFPFNPKMETREYDSKI